MNVHRDYRSIGPFSGSLYSLCLPFQSLYGFIFGPGRFDVTKS